MGSGLAKRRHAVHTRTGDAAWPARKASEDPEQQHKDVAPRCRRCTWGVLHLLNALHRRYPVPGVRRRWLWHELGRQRENHPANAVHAGVRAVRRWRRRWRHRRPMAVWHEQGPVRSQPMLHACLGPGQDDQEINALLEAWAGEITAAGCTGNRCRRTCVVQAYRAGR